MASIKGRAYRKMLSQGIAGDAVRFVVSFGSIAYAVAALPSAIAKAVVVLIIVLDLTAAGMVRFIRFSLNEQARKDEFDLSTNRLFYKLLIERIRGGSATIDVDELFTKAAGQARQDLAIADQREFSFDSTTWHFAGGVLSFSSQLIALLLWYGAAVLVGSALP